MRFVFPLAIILAGCASAPLYHYVLTSGLPAQAGRLETDKTICAGEMSKAKMGGVVIDTGNPFIDADASMHRDEDAGNVMLGCMAAKGYKFVPGQ